MNGIRLYFEAKNILGMTIRCYGDYLKRDDDVIVTDWGVLQEIHGETRRFQPAFVLRIVESKKNEIIFPNHEGCFNEFPTIK